MAAGATRSALTYHFARDGNAGDVSAKEGSQVRTPVMMHAIFASLLTPYAQCSHSIETQGIIGNANNLWMKEPKVMSASRIPLMGQEGEPSLNGIAQETAVTLLGMSVGMLVVHLAGG